MTLHSVFCFWDSLTINNQNKHQCVVNRDLDLSWVPSDHISLIVSPILKFNTSLASRLPDKIHLASTVIQTHKHT